MANAMGISEPGESLQRQARGYHDDFTDQHGRRFSAQYDLQNQRPIGELAPVDFNPPWLPPQRFIKWERKGGFKFRWDYATMANELSGMTAEYYSDAIKLALEHNKPEPEIGGPVDRTIRNVLGVPPLSPAIPLAAEIGEPWILGVNGAPVNQMLKDILEQNIGANGKEALDFIRKQMHAHIADNAVPVVPTIPAEEDSVKPRRTIHDASASDLLVPEISYQQFLTECKGRKMKMPDIVQAWNDHKAALEADLQEVA